MACSFTAPCFTLMQLRRQIQSMTIEDRKRQQADMKGTGEYDIKETPKLIRESLIQLDAEMEQLSDTENYQMAEFCCPDYAKGDKFRLMFLRSECFNVKLAAIRMKKYWDAKVYHFGSSKAFRELTLDDLDKDDLLAVEMGGLQILPKKDAAGRGLLYWNRTRFLDKPGQNKRMGRYAFYLIHAALEDESIQKHGVIQIFVLNKFIRDIQRILIVHCLNALPIRFVAVHKFKQGPNQLRHTIEQLLHLFPADLRIRQAVHEVGMIDDEDLAPYGFSLSMLPPEIGGTLQFDFKDWLRKRKKNEDESIKTLITEELTDSLF